AICRRGEAGAGTADLGKYERTNQKSVAARKSERRIDLREIVAGKARIRVAATGCAGRGTSESAWRASSQGRCRRLPRSERNRSAAPLHAAFHLESRHRSWHVSARLLHHEVQPARE